MLLLLSLLEQHMWTTQWYLNIFLEYNNVFCLKSNSTNKFSLYALRFNKACRRHLQNNRQIPSL